MVTKNLTDLLGPVFSSPQIAVENLVAMINSDNIKSYSVERPFDWIINESAEINKYISDINFLKFAASLSIAKKKYMKNIGDLYHEDVVQLIQKPDVRALFTETKEWYTNYFLPAICKVYFSLDAQGNFGVDTIWNKLKTVYSLHYSTYPLNESRYHFLGKKYPAALIQALGRFLKKYCFNLNETTLYITLFINLFDDYSAQALAEIQAILKQKQELENQLKIREMLSRLSAEEKNAIKIGYQQYWKQGKLPNEEEKKKIAKWAKANKLPKENLSNIIRPTTSLERVFKEKYARIEEKILTSVTSISDRHYAKRNYSQQGTKTIITSQQEFRLQAIANHTSNAVNFLYAKILEKNSDASYIKSIKDLHQTSFNEDKMRTKIAQDMLRNYLFKNVSLTDTENNVINEIIEHKEKQLRQAALVQQQILFRILNDFCAYKGIVILVDSAGQVNFKLPNYNDCKTLTVFSLTLSIAAAIAGPQGTYAVRRPLTLSEGTHLFNQIEKLSKAYESDLSVFEGRKLTIFLGKAKLFLLNLGRKHKLPEKAKSFFLWQETKNALQEILQKPNKQVFFVLPRGPLQEKPRPVNFY